MSSSAFFFQFHKIEFLSTSAWPGYVYVATARHNSVSNLSYVFIFLLDSKVTMFQFFYEYIGCCSWFFMDAIGYWLLILTKNKATIKDWGLILWLHGK